MKTLTPAVAAIVDQNLGVEPVNILEVQWTNGQYYRYGDKNADQTASPWESGWVFVRLNERVDGIILELSNLEAVVKLDSQGQSQSINVILDDTNGKIKNIINTTDVHGKKVRLLQWFEGLPLGEAFQLYEGEITSPITWSEGDRTISFSVITKLADKEVGFSPEEAQFNFLPNDLVGKPWPMAFGLVQNVPATRLQDVPITQSGEDLGVADPSIGAHGSRLGSQIGQLRFLSEYYRLALRAAQTQLTQAIFEGDEEAEAYWQGIVNTLSGNLASVNETLLDALEEKQALELEKAQQEEEQNNIIEVLDGAAFPQEEPITIAIDGILLTGVMSGNVFTISERTIEGYEYDEDSLDPYGFTWIQGGSTITLQTDLNIIYVANIMSSEVHSIQVFRQIENGQILVTIPETYYTVKEVTSGAYTFTLVEFPRALSSIDDTLSNDIYITQTGSVGPNTVDIIEWLIDTYTDLAYDSVSFEEVKEKLEKYPSHFAMLERKNILTTLEEIAMQARCSIWLNNGVFYLKYLSQEQEANLVITESDIDAGSMVLGTTQTEELVTKLTATWTDNYALEENHKIILRHNVKKYGTREREINFYIYNINELVLKSATFWLIRLSNIWKMLSFNTYVNNLVMETFDTVLLHFSSDYIASKSIRSMVTDLTYSTADGLLSVTCWLPVKFGEMVQYDFSWPADVSVDWEFPTEYEVTQSYDGSNGPGETVIINEITEITISGSRPGYIILDDKGDNVPSDLDDVKPEPRFPFSTFAPGEDPSRPYDYNDYSWSPEEPSPPTEEEFEGAVFPGKIIGQVTSGEDEEEAPATFEEGYIYEVDVYLDGLSEVPTSKQVVQLQLKDSEIIPSGAWVLVAKNSLPEDSQDLNGDTFQWTMQVPVWL